MGNKEQASDEFIEELKELRLEIGDVNQDDKIAKPSLRLQENSIKEVETVYQDLAEKQPVLEKVFEKKIPEIKMPEKKSYHILVVEDDAFMIKLLKQLLSRNKYKVTQAINGAEVIDIFNKNNYSDDPIDLVLLDIMLPKMSGYEVCKLLRERYPADKLPILMLTGKTQAEDLVMGLKSGANDYVKKPFSKTELLARIENHLTLTQLAEEHRYYQEELNKYRNRLEELVKERTLELLKTNKQLELEIADKRYVENSLRDSEKRFTSLVDHINEYIYSVEYKDGKPVSSYHSSRCLDITGYNPEEFYKKPSLSNDIIHQDDIMQVISFFDKSRHLNSPSTIKHRINDKEGSVRWISNTCMIRTNDAKQIESIDGIIVDITKLKQVHILLEDIEQSCEKDLRNSSADIIRSSEILLEQITNEEQKESLVSIRSNGEKIIQLMEKWLAEIKKNLGRVD